MFYISSQKLAVFTHFSYFVSQENLMLTDLQGSSFILTDPSFHTECPHPYYIEEETDYHSSGFASFLFFQHPDCGELCGKMGIRRDPEKE
jgi:hypothetical protein